MQRIPLWVPLSARWALASPRTLRLTHLEPAAVRAYLAGSAEAADKPLDDLPRAENDSVVLAPSWRPAGVT